MILHTHALVHSAQRTGGLACLTAMSAECLRSGPLHALLEVPGQRCTIVGGRRGLWTVGNGGPAMHLRQAAKGCWVTGLVAGQGSRLPAVRVQMYHGRAKTSGTPTFVRLVATSDVARRLRRASWAHRVSETRAVGAGDEGAWVWRRKRRRVGYKTRRVGEASKNRERGGRAQRERSEGARERGVRESE